MILRYRHCLETRRSPYQIKKAIADGNSTVWKKASIGRRIEAIFNDRRYADRLSKSRQNWMEIPAAGAFSAIREFLQQYAMKYKQDFTPDRPRRSGVFVFVFPHFAITTVPASSGIGTLTTLPASFSKSSTAALIPLNHPL